MEFETYYEPTEADMTDWQLCMEEWRAEDAGAADISEDEYWASEPRCSSPTGHEWAYTGLAYGGDDPSYMGEGRCYCVHCGADGDA